MAETKTGGENISPERHQDKKKDDIDIYSPEITERVIKLIRKVDIPEVLKEHLIANIDNYDRAELVRMLGKYFERNKAIREDEEKTLREYEEARKRLMDAIEVNKQSDQNDVW